jgi:hypothetical protein
VSITTKVVGSNPAHGEGYSIQQYVKVNMSNYSYDIIIVFLLKTTVWMPSVIIMILSLNAHVCSKRISLSYQGFVQHAYFIIHLYCYFIIVYTWLQVLSLVLLCRSYYQCMSALTTCTCTCTCIKVNKLLVYITLYTPGLFISLS